jgi:hypothetical protein
VFEGVKEIELKDLSLSDEDCNVLYI